MPVWRVCWLMLMQFFDELVYLGNVSVLLSHRALAAVPTHTYYIMVAVP